MTERLYTTAEAAAELGIPAQTIKDWKVRRRVMPAGMIRGTSRTGQVPLYRLEDLRPHAEAYLRRAATRGPISGHK